MSDPFPLPDRRFPRVPAYAWAWFQRSRPVRSEAARRLTGGAGDAAFVEELRAQFAADPFVRDVVIGVVAEVAFNGRPPSRRPPGASWDRGLIWWAAAIAGLSPEEFEARSRAPVADQHVLFGAASAPTRTGGTAAAAVRATPRRVRMASSERAALAAALRDLLALADDERVPADAVRALLAQLEGTA